MKKTLHYYRFHRYKVVIYYYDHTAISQDGKVDYSYAQELVNAFRAHPEWKIIPIYIGVTPPAKVRYELAGEVFRREHEKIRSIAINRENCGFLLESLRNAQIKKGTSLTEDYRKNKDDERNLELDQKKTTHKSDAFDTLLVGVCNFDPRTVMSGFEGLDVVTS